MEIRIDEKQRLIETRDLGIEVGDFVSLIPELKLHHQDLLNQDT